MLKKECEALKKVDNNYWYHDQDQRDIYDHGLQRFWRFT